MQPPPHSVRPLEHPASQLPALQTWLAPHAFAHAPQLFGSEAVVVQTPLQSVSPAAQTQAEPLQILPPEQAALQAPQWFWSLPRSTQLAPHWVRLPLHCVAHTPRSQTSPLAHVTPHAPQWAGSVSGSTQTPAHSISPVVHSVGPPSPASEPALPPAPPVAPVPALPPVPPVPPVLPAEPPLPPVSDPASVAPVPPSPPPSSSLEHWV